MSAGDRGVEFAETTFDVCMQLVHAPGQSMAASKRECLLHLATAAVRVLAAAAPAPGAAMADQLRPRLAVWRYA